MPDENKDGLAPQPQETEKKSYTPASRGKRIAAWIGVVLMVFLVIAYSYSLATGAFLNW